jgi:hypothetical protein
VQDRILVGGERRIVERALQSNDTVDVLERKLAVARRVAGLLREEIAAHRQIAERFQYAARFLERSWNPLKRRADVTPPELRRAQETLRHTESVIRDTTAQIREERRGTVHQEIERRHESLAATIRENVTGLSENDIQQMIIEHVGSTSDRTSPLMQHLSRLLREGSLSQGQYDAVAAMAGVHRLRRWQRSNEKSALASYYTQRIRRNFEINTTGTAQQKLEQIFRHPGARSIEVQFASTGDTLAFLPTEAESSEGRRRIFLVGQEGTASGSNAVIDVAARTLTCETEDGRAIHCRLGNPNLEEGMNLGKLQFRAIEPRTDDDAFTRLTEAEPDDAATRTPEATTNDGEAEEPKRAPRRRRRTEADPRLEAEGQYEAARQRAEAQERDAIARGEAELQRPARRARQNFDDINAQLERAAEEAAAERGEGEVIQRRPEIVSPPTTEEKKEEKAPAEAPTAPPPVAPEKTGKENTPSEATKAPSDDAAVAKAKREAEWRASQRFAEID